MSRIANLEGLTRAGLLGADEAERLSAVARRHAVSVTPHLAARLIDESRRAPDDPLRRQYVPSEAEAEERPEELADPIGDLPHQPVKGVVHRYPDRALLKPLHVCPVYCRFCFRREMVGPGGEALNDDELTAALDHIAATPAIWEVVVTGGDPFMLSPRRLGVIMDALSAMEHVAVARFHTRVPVADPERVTPELVESLRRDGVATWVAVHVNHADEFDPASVAAVARLVDSGVPLVGQTVLLRGVNDDADTLDRLFRAMVRHRIKPYYLHHPDMAVGTGHFRVDLDTGDRLTAGLRGRLSGLAQPTYVLDIPGGHGKVPAGRAWVSGDQGAGWRVRDPTGREHEYPPREREADRETPPGRLVPAPT